LTTGQLLLDTPVGRVTADLVAGQAYRRGKGPTHDVVDDNPFEFVVIERNRAHGVNQGGTAKPGQPSVTAGCPAPTQRAPVTSDVGLVRSLRTAQASGSRLPHPVDQRAADGTLHRLEVPASLLNARGTRTAPREQRTVVVLELQIRPDMKPAEQLAELPHPSSS
jgi:hypothetical protein